MIIPIPFSNKGLVVTMNGLASASHQMPDDAIFYIEDREAAQQGHAADR